MEASDVYRKFGEEEASCDLSADTVISVVGSGWSQTVSYST